MRTDIGHILLPKTATVRDAMRVMSGAEKIGIAMVVDAGRRLLGIVVDSDLRRAMLNGRDLKTPLAAIMNVKPVTLPVGLPREEIVAFFQREGRACIPLLDGRRRVAGLALLTEYLAQAREMPNTVVLLVGGQGKRLRPLTEDRPKPLLPVGDKPLLETIIEQFLSHGFKRFVLAVNHHADQIRRHFGDGARLGADIRYIHERDQLGTAGPLSLLPPGLRDPLIVMNGDLLTKIDFRALLEFHREQPRLATLCVREYDFQVPYGVVQMKSHTMTRIDEKPTHRFFVNAGIYVLEPFILRWLPKNKRCDMPAFLERVNGRKPGSIACFPIREYWLDIGQIEQYKQAQSEYAEFF